MSRKIVIYTSKRGSTKQYAEWIAESLNAECKALSDCSKQELDDLLDYDLVIYGSWLRGSGIVGFDKIQPYLVGIEDRTVMFMTGISQYTPENYMQICEINFEKLENMGAIKLYFCPGRYDPKNVKGLDKIMMGIAKSVLNSGRTAEGSEDADKMIDRINNGVDMVDRANTEQVLRAARKILGEA